MLEDTTMNLAKGVGGNIDKSQVLSAVEKYAYTLSHHGISFFPFFFPLLHTIASYIYILFLTVYNLDYCIATTCWLLTISLWYSEREWKLYSQNC